MSEIDRLARWIVNNEPDEIGPVVAGKERSAVDVAIRLIEQARQVYPAARLLVQATGSMLDGWAEADDDRRRHLWRELHTRCDELGEALDRAGQRWDQPAADPHARHIRSVGEQTSARTAPDPPVETSPAVERDMQRIAATYPAVEYDACDRPEEVAAVVAAAKAAGLVPVPSETITPRTYRGCALPAWAHLPPWAHPLGRLTDAVFGPVGTAPGPPVRPVLIDAAMRDLAEAARPVLEALVTRAADPTQVAR